MSNRRRRSPRCSSPSVSTLCLVSRYTSLWDSLGTPPYIMPSKSNFLVAFTLQKLWFVVQFSLMMILPVCWHGYNTIIISMGWLLLTGPRSRDSALLSSHHPLSSWRLQAVYRPPAFLLPGLILLQIPWDHKITYLTLSISLSFLLSLVRIKIRSLIRTILISPVAPSLVHREPESQSLAVL